MRTGGRGVRQPPSPERRERPRAGLLRPVADGLYGVIRWIRHHVQGIYAAVGLFLTLGLALSLVSLVAFGWIARDVAGGLTHTLDSAAVAWLGGHSAPPWDALALVGAGLGSGIALWVVLGLGSVYFLYTRHLYSLALLWLALLGARVLNQTLKETFARPRPGVAGSELEILGRTFDYPASYSFPSGHAVTATVVFGTLAYLIIRLEPTVRMRRLTLAGAVLLILLIGVSRIYLGVHYPSDVLAGYLAGFIWATFAVFAIEVVRYFVPRKPEIAGQERDIEEGLRPLRQTVHGPGDS